MVLIPSMVMINLTFFKYDIEWLTNNMLINQPKFHQISLFVASLQAHSGNPEGGPMAILGAPLFLFSLSSFCSCFGSIEFKMRIN